MSPVSLDRPHQACGCDQCQEDIGARGFTPENPEILIGIIGERALVWWLNEPRLPFKLLLPYCSLDTTADEDFEPPAPPQLIFYSNSNTSSFLYVAVSINPQLFQHASQVAASAPGSCSAGAQRVYG